MAISNSASPEIIWGLEGPEEDHQLHHCYGTGRVGEREEEEEEVLNKEGKVTCSRKAQEPLMGFRTQTDQ